MKKFFSVVLIAIILLQAFSKVIVLVNFKLNEDFISKNSCENRSNPQMHCNGKCQLKKQFSKQEKNENAPQNNSKNKNEIQFFSEGKTNNALINSGSKIIFNPVYLFSFSTPHTRSVFHPPSA